MSRFGRIDVLDPYYTSLVVREASIFAPKSLAFPSFLVEEEHDDLSFALELLNPCPTPFHLFDPVSDLIQIENTPFFSSYKRIQRRVGTEFCLQTLCDRVSALESRFDKLINPKRISGGDRKYTWTAEIKGPVEKKYKWTAEIKEGRKTKEEKNYKWVAEIKEKEEEQPIARKYTFEVSSGDAGVCSGSGKKDKKETKEKKKENAVRLVEIEEPNNHGAVVLLRQVQSLMKMTLYIYI